MIDLDHCKKLGLKLVEINRGEKGPTREGWNKKPVKYKKLRKLLKDAYSAGPAGGINIGILHEFSDTIVFDIDDLKAAKKIKLLKKHVLPDGAGLSYTSGVKNRIKVLFKIPTGYKKKIFRTHSLPLGCGQFRCGAGIMDVAVGSLHPSGSVYNWVNGGGSATSIPELPTAIADLIKAEYKFIKKAKKNGSTDSSVTKYPFIGAYNKWFMEQGGSIIDAVLDLGGYELAGFNTLKRIGSGNKQAVIIYQDSDGIDRACNFSDTVGDDLLPPNVLDNCMGRICDPYAVLTVAMGFDEAREYVCSVNPEIAKLVDVESDKIELGLDKVGLNGDTGIEYDSASGCPSLSLSTMIPIDSKFGALVDSLMFHQIQVHNPNMAFWYALVLIDYLAGGGYSSVMTATMSPLYCFTSGTSSDGKTRTIGSGETHLFEIGGGGEPADAPSMSFDASADKKTDQPTFATWFENKRQIDDAGSVEGIKDLIGKTLGHGCDVLYTHDEFGITTSGGSSQRNDSMKGFIMMAKSLDRKKPFRYRLKAQNKDNKEGTDTYCVHFNYFTSTTNEALKGVLGDSDVGQGFMQRFIGGPSITKHNSTRVEKYGSIAPNGARLNKKVLKSIKAIVQQSSKVMGMDRSTSGLPVKMADGVEDLINAKSVWIGEQTRLGNNENLKILENILPIARARAIIENPKKPIVTVAMFQWADTVASSSVLFFKWLLGELKEKEPLPVNVDVRIENRILNYLNKQVVDGAYTPVTRKQVVRKTGIASYGTAAYSPVMEMMEKEGVLVFEKLETESGQLANMITAYTDFRDA